MPTKGKDGFYHSKVTPAKGVKPVYFRARTLREFNQERQRIIEEYRTGRNARSVTFIELAEEWWQVVRQPRQKASSAAMLRSCLKTHILAWFPPQQLARAVRYKDLQACVDSLQGFSLSTVSHVIGMLRGICHYGVAEGAMDADYSTALRRPKLAKPSPRLALTADQAAALRAAFVPEPVHLALALQYYCGLRCGESLAVQWGDIDFSAKRLHVVRQFSKTTRTITDLKTEHSDRYVDTPDELITLLDPLRGLPAVYVCTGSREPLTYGAFNYQFVKLMVSLDMAHINDCSARAEARAQKKGVPFRPWFNPNYYDCDFTPHNLRHNYATAVYRAGIDPALAMQLLGHSSYDTTLSIYTDIHSMLDDSVSLDDYLPAVMKKVANKLQTKVQSYR